MLALLASWPGPAAGDKLPGRAFFRKNRTLCEKKWPRQKNPAKDTTLACARYWVLRYGYDDDGRSSNADEQTLLEEDPSVNGEIVTRLLAHELTAMASHVRAVAGMSGRDQDQGGAQAPPIIDRAIEFFEGAARSHFSLSDPGTGWNDRIDEFLETIFAGKPLRSQALPLLSPVSLWKLRNAIYARHGRPFKNPDLQRFFYGDRGLPDETTPLLPRKVNPRFHERMLTAEDKANLALIKKAERGQVPLE